jgi:CO/xanthine dehydrogenase Mo-binding subunit
MLNVAPQIFEREVEKISLIYLPEGSVVFPDEDRSLSLPISDFVRMAREKGMILEAEDIYDPGVTYYDHKTGRGRPYPGYTYAAQVVEVAVDDKTGKIDVLRVVVAQDVGRAINPKMVEGQLEGSVVMGIGWVLKEKFLPGKTESFSTYRIPLSTDVPEITTILLENDEPGAPFGAKGVAEATIVPTGAAVVNAIAHATGVRFNEIPVDINRLVRK